MAAGSYGNPHFPDGWSYTQAGGASREEPLVPGSPYCLGWLWAASQGMPGDPAVLRGGDVLVFLVAHCDATVVAADAELDVAFSPHITYHDGTAYYGYGGGDASAYHPDQPTPKYAAHYRRLASLLPGLDRFRCVILRGTDLGPALGTDPGSAARAEAHLSAHFRAAVAGGGGYAALGPGLGALGFELREKAGVEDAADLIDLARRHFGLR
jgi:hypothetical protein